MLSLIEAHKPLDCNMITVKIEVIHGMWKQIGGEPKCALGAKGGSAEAEASVLRCTQGIRFY